MQGVPSSNEQTKVKLSKRKDARRADALRAAEERVKECRTRLELAKLTGNQSEIETRKLSIAMAQFQQLKHKVKRKAKS